MKSATPKVLHGLCGRSMLGHVIAAARGLAPERLVVVVGHGREQVCAHLAEIDDSVRAVVQEVQHGTGHAVRIAMEALGAEGALDGTVVVTYGDTPLLTTGTLDALVTVHQEAGNAVTVLTANVPDPTGYGRIVRTDGAVTASVEPKDPTAEPAAIRGIHSGGYAVGAQLLVHGVSRRTHG